MTTILTNGADKIKHTDVVCGAYCFCITY